MGIATFPAAASGLSSAIKSVQRGTAVSAGNITITAVDMSKTLVNSFSTGSAGSVAATGSINAANGSTSGFSIAAGNISGVQNYSSSGRYSSAAGGFSTSVTLNAAAKNANAQNIGLNSTSLTGGSTDLTTKSYGAYLSTSTNLVVTGPCQYEVVEYN
jgi:hypothetical protein